MGCAFWISYDQCWALPAIILPVVIHIDLFVDLSVTTTCLHSRDRFETVGKLTIPLNHGPSILHRHQDVDALHSVLGSCCERDVLWIRGSGMLQCHTSKFRDDFVVF